MSATQILASFAGSFAGTAIVLGVMGHVIGGLICILVSTGLVGWSLAVYR